MLSIVIKSALIASVFAQNNFPQLRTLQVCINNLLKNVSFVLSLFAWIKKTFTSSSYSIIKEFKLLGFLYQTFILFSRQYVKYKLHNFN